MFKFICLSNYYALEEENYMNRKWATLQKKKKLMKKKKMI